MIIDIQALTYQVLNKVAAFENRIYPDYPKVWQDFPMAIYRTKRTSHFVDAHKEELQSYWVITIEIYGDNNTGDLTPIVEQVDNEMKQKGFMGNDTDSNTGDLSRKILEYRGIVDNVTHFVYQK